MAGFTALSDDQTVIAKIDPASQAAGTVDLSTYVDMKAFEVIQVVVGVGVISSGGTVDVSIRQATSNTGTSVKALATAKAVTQLTQAGSNSNSVVVLNVRATDLDTNNGFEFVSPHIVVGTAAAILYVLVLGQPQATPPTTTNGTVSAQVIL